MCKKKIPITIFCKEVFFLFPIVEFQELFILHSYMRLRGLNVTETTLVVQNSRRTFSTTPQPIIVKRLLTVNGKSRAVCEIVKKNKINAFVSTFGGGQKNRFVSETSGGNSLLKFDYYSRMTS